MKLRYLTLLILTGALVALPAYAMTLDQARGAGAVGEKMDGYVAALKQTPEIEALVADVNAKRKQEYTRISKENGQPVEVVAKLAVPQIVNKLSAGSLYQAPDKSWKKR